jgi:hypothetical protein
MNSKKCLLTAMVFGGLCTLAVAQESPWGALKASPTRVYTSVGTQGLGVGVAKSLNSSLDLRVGVSVLNFNQSTSGESLSADVGLKLQNLGLYADYFPFESSGFRLTGGVQMGNNKVDITGKPGKDGIKVGGIDYPVGSNDSITGKLDMGSTAPYLGIGYSQHGPTKTGFSLNFDLGVRIGKANVTLNRNGFSNVPDQNKFDSDLKVEETKLRDDLSILKTYPVIATGMSYRW